MIYPIIPQNIPQSKRADINDKIILSIAKGKKDFTNTEVYNSYTGIGGLHGLDFDDYNSYHEYSGAKKAIELGQFFTPHEICKQMVELVSPEPSEMVLDMCCGMGNFFNFLPNQFNAYGFDIEENAIKIAKRLYPDANIEVNDLKYYDPNMSFDVIFGNPPFNLDFDGIHSQHYFSYKAYWLLNPGGLMVLVMPMSYLADESRDRTYINMINRDFSFIGQTRLETDAFGSLGVENFGTKIMAFMRKSDSMELIPYQAAEFVGMEGLQHRMDSIKTEKKKARLKLLRERNMIAEGNIESRLKKYKASKEDIKTPGKRQKVTQKSVKLNLLFQSMSCHEGSKSFERTLQKYLYELKTHKHLKKQYPKALSYVSKYRNQQPPLNCTNEEREKWEKYKKILPAQVLKRLRNIIKKQYAVAEKKYVLRQTPYGFKLKNLANPFSERNTDKYIPLYDLVANDVQLPQPQKMTLELARQYKYANKYIARKKRIFALENAEFKSMQRDPELDKYIDSLSFIGMKQTECKFSDLQKHDMGLLYQKKYSLLNWQQGSGKTAVLYNYGKYLLETGKVKNVAIVAPSIAIHLTWVLFLRYNNADFVVVSSPKQLKNIPPGKIVVFSVSMLGKVDDAIIRFMKERSQKVCLLFDESDELTNDASQRTKRTLKCFRRAKYKMLGTGTTTRNYVSELYSQITLLYNNSVNMMCYCYESYYEDDHKVIRPRLNDYYNKPFPRRGGARLFKACFNPGKATVFGIEKQNQDVYNKDSLWALIGKAIITRKFREFAGDKYTIHTQAVAPAAGELGVYEKVIKEFVSIWSMFFNSTGDSKKDSMLKIVRQIQLLIKACSVPDLMPGYCSDDLPQKVQHIENMVRNINEKVAVGCTSLEALEYYEKHFVQVFPERTLFVIKGELTFNRRQKILRAFEATDNGILLCMQQSLKSSVNIPECNEVILESLQWNIPRMEQFYFRFIRFDSEGYTNVHFVNYSNSIEQNIMALILTKERLNDFIQTGEVTEESAIFDEFGVSTSIIDSLFTREQDKEGKFHISWGEQKVAC